MSKTPQPRELDELELQARLRLTRPPWSSLAISSGFPDLQSKMYVNCIYCGHRYGPDPDTPVAIAEVLKQHIEECPSHPMSLLKARNAALVKMLEAALHCVRSYQFGNAAPALGEEMSDAIEKLLKG